MDHRETGVQTSQIPSRETSPMLSPDPSMRRDRLSTRIPSGPPHRCSSMIIPFVVGFGAGAYSIYKVYSKMKAPIPPKRNMTMSVTRNRY